MWVLGISAFYHDSAAALVCDGQIISAAQEERFSRQKFDPTFPVSALDYCLREGGIGLHQVDQVVFYDKPFLKFERLLETYVNFAPRGFNSFRMAVPLWLDEKLFLKRLLVQRLAEMAPGVDWAKKLLFSEHHLSHAASAFYPSPFQEAAVLTMDGVGEWATTSLALGCGENIEVLMEIHFPDSLGLLYSAFTYYAGFRVNSGEYKLMGLAPYGQPRYRDLILEHLIDIKDVGSFRLDQRYFDYCAGLTMTSQRFHELFGGLPRKPSEPLTQRHMDIAASIQCVAEEAVLRLARTARRETGLKHLCMAGGVALNCVANGKVRRDGAFERIWIQPAAGDAGGAIGAALLGYHAYSRQPRVPSSRDAMRGSFLGPGFPQAEVERRLAAVGARFQVLSTEQLLTACAQALAEGKALGWFQGRMEFGPRALGARSILGDARSPTMQSVLNLKVKFRESFRPFAPAVLREHVAEWFDLGEDSPYMLLVADVVPTKRRAMTQEEQCLFGIDKLNVVRSQVPAVTHVDYSARIQTVDRETNPTFHALISDFHRLTGCPVLVNTSFNVRGEPIVCTPEDAFRCFMGTGVELLAVERCLLKKEEQSAALDQHHRGRFEDD